MAKGMSRKSRAASPSIAPDPEIAAINLVYEALKDLSSESQRRVLDYVAVKVGAAESRQKDLTGETSGRHVDDIDHTHDDDPGKRNESIEGISPVGAKWMKRNDLSANRMSSVFSLGVDEIDLVAKEVPGKKGNKKARMHSVLLLKGVASYLGSGVARVSHDGLKEACLHYDAYDVKNFAKHLKSFSAEASGSKESGYTLTARGLTEATTLLKSMMNP